MPETVIDALYEQNRAAIQYFAEAAEVSLATDLDNKLKKHLVMAAASYFEAELRSIIERFAARASNNNLAVISLVRSKALERQYHTLFDWEKRNANKFFSHFGDDFSSQCRQDVIDRPDLAESIAAFLELGETRNKLAHLNFALFPVEKTSDEVYVLYKKALSFVGYIRERFNACCGAPPDAGPPVGVTTD